MENEFSLALLRDAVASGDVQWHQHALARAIERGIYRAEVIQAVLDGEMIEIYTNDRPYPSCLMLRAEVQPLHVVAAVDTESVTAHIITVYRPDPLYFEMDWKTRRKQS